jgi:hypothetical protein
MDIEQVIIRHTLVPINLNNQSNLFVQDRVLVRMIREGEEYWAPGEVIGLPLSFDTPTNSYLVRVYAPFSQQVG